MTWINTIEYNEAGPKLKRIYDRVKGPENNVDNVLLIHSLRPHTLTGHMTLYKSVLHHKGNSLPKWYLEAIGVYVSYLNSCNYCFEHHFAGFKRLYPDKGNAESFRTAVIDDKLESFLDSKFLAGCHYARNLTLHHAHLTRRDIETLSAAGFSDGEILEINQVASYFNYVNRTVVGLGVDIEGDVLGLSPGDSENPDDWSHS